MDINLSAGEKLILLMLCDIHEHLKIKGNMDPKFIKNAIHSGNLWGLDWGLPGVFQVTETPRDVVKETVDIMAMWDRLEQSFQNLGKKDKEWLAKEAVPFGDDVKFQGWDGNDNLEIEYISAAHFLVDNLGRFRNFKGRDFNAHMTTLDGHRKMLAVFDPILKQVLNQDFSAQQIAEVLKARRG